MYGRAQRASSDTAAKDEHRGIDHGLEQHALCADSMSSGDGHQPHLSHLEQLALTTLVRHASAGNGRWLLQHYQASGHFLLERDGRAIARVRVLVELIEGDGHGT